MVLAKSAAEQNHHLELSAAKDKHLRQCHGQMSVMFLPGDDLCQNNISSSITESWKL